MEIAPSYDVVIAGGGPGGSTLAALLQRKTGLRVLVIEAETFPREHIGESFTQRVTSVLAESGGLAKILASGCWVKKFGGYYAWGDGDPAVSLFEHKDWERDGILRWSFHADRPQMDSILLQHARDCGAAVLEGVGVKTVDLLPDEHVVLLDDGRRVGCRLFVDATGRVTDLASRQRKKFLSQYQNIAIWTHVVDALPAQAAAGDWNVFRKLGVSSIGSYAFEDGWFWYIPVPKIIDGARVVTHSLGVVTDPRVLKQPGKDFRDLDRLMDAARRTPILGELVADARPITARTSTATNYSMIADRFCSYDERWISIGDAAYFVDPLFSSGVAFTVNHASSAALLIQSMFSEALPERDKRDLFHDYDEGWRRIASSFALVLDQWYHAIARNHPGSIYWQTRINESLVDLRLPTFNALVDTAVSPDLLLVITKGEGKLSELGTEGPLVEVLGRAGQEPDDDQELALAADVTVRPTLSLGAGRSMQNVALMNFPADEALARLRDYWADPVANQHRLPALYEKPLQFHRFERATGEGGVGFFDPRDGGLRLAELLREKVRYGDVRPRLTELQRVLVRKLLGADMLDLGPSPTDAP